MVKFRIIQTTLKNIYLLTALFLFALGIGKMYFSNYQLISGDGIYYYAQARSLIKDLDWSFANEMEIYQADHKPRTLHTHPETGRVVNKYPIGSALLWLPFLFVSHLISLFLQVIGYTGVSSGYSFLDQLFLLIASIVYFLFSAHLILLTARKIFIRLKIPGFLGVAFLLCTTAMYYAAVEPSMSHIPALFSIGLFLYLSIRLIHKKQPIITYLFYGFSAALMILVRNQNVFFLLLPLFYLLPKEHFKLKHFLLSASAGLLFLIPQFLYWKLIYGHWLMYSYQGESFAYLTQPKFLAVLFSAESGLISWHPVHILSVSGLVYLGIKGKAFMRIFLVLLAIQLYLYASWECWWLGDSFGYRGLANALPLLFPGFVWFHKKAGDKERLPLFYLGLVVLFLWNLYLLALYAAGKISHSGSLQMSALFGWW